MKPIEILNSIKEKYNIDMPWSKDRDRIITSNEWWKQYEHIIIEAMEHYLICCTKTKTQMQIDLEHKLKNDQFKEMLKNE